MSDAVVIVGRIADEKPWIYTIYETDYRPPGGETCKHIMSVPVAVSAVSFEVNIPLNSAESRKVDSGDEQSYFETLARQVKDNPHRFRGVRISQPPRFVL
jgi:hypothetical protein